MQKSLYKDVSQPVEELATLVFHHFGKVPMGWTGIDKLTEYAHNDQFVNKVFMLYEYILSHNELITSINPSQYYKIIYKFQLAVKSLNYSVHDITNCYLSLANHGICVYNYFLSQIENETKEVNFVDVLDDKDRSEVAYLSALLRSYSEILYCDEHTIAGEIYSPIEFYEDIVIARQYRWLDAIELRSELAYCTIRGLKIYARYHGLNKKVNTDIVGNLLVNENILPFLTSVYIEIQYTNGKTKVVNSFNEIKDISNYFKLIIPQLVNNYKNMSKHEKLWKKIECEYYAFKPFCDIVGLDWKPKFYHIDEVAITNKLRPIVRANEEIKDLLDNEEIQKKLFILNDPRVHWE